MHRLQGYAHRRRRGAAISSSDAGLTLAGDGGGICVPRSCADLGFNCGMQSDTCGNVISCGVCVFPQTCGGGGTPSVCGLGGNCTGLCLNQVQCPSSGTTSISGVTYMPNGTTTCSSTSRTDLSPRSARRCPGVTGGNCNAEVSGNPLVATVSAVDGTFTLNNVPVGVSFPVVMQLGRFRRQFTMPAVTMCTSTPVPCTSAQACLSRFPQTQFETSAADNIPKMAFSTGEVDALECVWAKIGIASTGAPGSGGTNYGTGEFTPGPTSGRINLYAGSGANGSTSRTVGTTDAPRKPDGAVRLRHAPLSCQGGEFSFTNQKTYQTNIANFANRGRARVRDALQLHLVHHSGHHVLVAAQQRDQLDAQWQLRGLARSDHRAHQHDLRRRRDPRLLVDGPRRERVPGLRRHAGQHAPPRLQRRERSQRDLRHAQRLRGHAVGLLQLRQLRHPVRRRQGVLQRRVRVLLRDGPHELRRRRLLQPDERHEQLRHLRHEVRRGLDVRERHLHLPVGDERLQRQVHQPEHRPEQLRQLRQGLRRRRALRGRRLHLRHRGPDRLLRRHRGRVREPAERPCELRRVRDRFAGPARPAPPARAAPAGQARPCAPTAASRPATRRKPTPTTAAPAARPAPKVEPVSPACASARLATPTAAAPASSCRRTRATAAPAPPRARAARRTARLARARTGAAPSPPAPRPASTNRPIRSSCGSCTNKCAAGEACVGGACNGCVEAGAVICSGDCVLLSNDNNNCGACGTKCGYDQTCVGGVCACPSGFSACTDAGHNVCVNKQTDPYNCGGCNVVCAAGQTCTAGACVAVATTCSATASDPYNCGGCGVVCGNGQTCVSGTCTCGSGATTCTFPLQASFNTPLTATANNQCGRVVVSDFHRERQRHPGPLPERVSCGPPHAAGVHARAGASSTSPAA